VKASSRTARPSAAPQSRTPAGRVVIHTFVYGGSARLLLVWVALVLFIGLPCAFVHLIRTGQACELPQLVVLSAAFCFITWLQMRERPLAHGSATGLELEWAWGAKRHIDWVDIRSIKATSLLGRFLGRRFRLELGAGALEFYARSDFPELVEQFKHGGRAR
jgi:hypothetical protein